MRKFTKLWRWMMIVLISSSILVVQAQKSVSTQKASAKVELNKNLQKEVNENEFTKEQIIALEKQGIIPTNLSTKELLNEAELMQLLETYGVESNNPEITDAVSVYTFSHSVGTFTPITGGTSLGTETTDDQRFVDPAIPAGGTTLTGVGFPIGFDFTYNGYVFDRLAINANGWISLGQSALTPAVNITSTSSYTPLSSTSAIAPVQLRSRIAGIGRDLQSQVGATLRIETIGTTPNQVCVIQWDKYKKYGTTGTGDSFSFQIRLNEGSNEIEVVYGTMTSNTTSTTVQVGLGGDASTDFFNRSTTTDWAATIAGVTNASSCTLSDVVYPVSGTTFTFSPPPPGAPGSPSNPNPLNGAIGVAVNTNLTWDFGVLTDNYDLYLDVVNPPLTKVVDDAVAGVGLYDPPADLNTSTTYYWQVVARNASKLETAGPVWSFATACGAYTAPFVENFQNTTIPLCWSISGPQNWLFTNTWPDYGADLLADHTGTGGSFAGVDGSGTVSITGITLTTPFIDVTPLTDPALRFYLFNNNVDNADYQTLSVDLWDGAAWNNGVFFWGPADNDPDWVEVIVGLSPYTITGDVQFRFVVDKSAGSPFYDDLIIDDVYVEEAPDCLNPGTLGATNITTSQADLTWVSISGLSDIEFGDFGFVPTGVPTDAGKTSPYTKTGLSASSTYSFYVRDDCGGGAYSNWVGPYSFTTPCATFVAPFYEPFQNTTIPLCWEMSGPQPWLFTTTWPGYGATGLTDHTGTGGSFAGVDGSGTASLTGITLTTPFIDVTPLTDPALRFYLFNDNIDNAIDYQTLSVDLWDGAAWNNGIYFWGPTDNNPDWVEVIVALSPYTITGDVQFRFVVDKSVGSPFYDDLIIDDVYVEEAPTCPNPSSLGATNITTAQADLTWISPSGLSDIEFGPAGFVPTGTPTDVGKTSPYTKMGLSSSSSYSFYVRDDCGGGEYSNWIGPYTFDTPCEAFALPYCNTFDDAAFPLCWTQGYAAAVTSDRWNVNLTNNAGGASGANEMRAYWQNVVGESWLTSPEFTIPAGGAILTFDHFYDDYGAGLDLSVRFSNDGGTNWTTGYTIVSGGGNVGPETLNIPITLSGNVIIQWYMTGNHFQLDAWYVDDVCLIVPLAHDAKTESVDVPGLVVPGIVAPMATVANNGSNVETFDVTMTINPGGYSSTKTVTALDPFTPIQVTFDDWTAAVGDYTVEVCTQLAGDLDISNDCLSKMVSVQDLRIAYCYIAYDPTASLPEGPAYFYVQDPGSIYSLASTTSDQFIGAGTWANGTWYGSEYYDATLLSGGGWWTIDPTDGTMTKLGDFDQGFSGITYDPSSSTMYGMLYNSTSLNSELYTVDPATGASTFLGITITGGLAINLASDGSGFLYTINISDDQLYQIDPTAVPPTAVAIGPTGYAFNYAQDMEYDFENDIMYVAGYHASGELMTIDLTTGACTPVGAFQGGSEITGFALPYTPGFRVYGNVYYGNTGTTKPMETNTTIMLDPGAYSEPTGPLGYYDIGGLSDGAYLLTGATTKPGNDAQITTADGILTTRIAAGVGGPYSTLQFRAADVNASNGVTTSDAILVKRRAAGLTSPFAAPVYVFDGPFGPPNPTLGGIPVNVSGADVMQEVRCLLSGDVNSSHTPAP